MKNLLHPDGRPLHILLTGAQGGVGKMLRPLLAATGAKLRLSDRSEVPNLASHETSMAAELTDPAACASIVQGIDGIIHLGGYSIEGPWDAILQSNIEGYYHLMDAAQQANVPRIVFASSNHAVGFHERSRTIDEHCKVRPDSRYGVSKVFGEALGALYADKFGIRVTNLRIGNVGFVPIDRRRLSIWLHPEDLLQLIVIGLTHPNIYCETFYGMSDNSRAWWDNSRAAAFGYQPVHRSEDYAAEVLARVEVADPIADRYQGGTFCVEDHPERVPRG